jgi:hypothetical protein
MGSLASAQEAVPFPILVPVPPPPHDSLQVSFHGPHPHVVPQVILSYLSAGREVLGLIEEPAELVPPADSERWYTDEAGRTWLVTETTRPQVRVVLGPTQVRAHSDTLALSDLTAVVDRLTQPPHP